MATKKRNRTLGVRVDGKTREWLERVARENDRNISWVIRSSLEYARLRDEGAGPTAARKAGAA